MARRSNHRFAKQMREQQKQKRAAARAARKLDRTSSEENTSDPDLDGILAGPQPVGAATDEEVQEAIERAMNPGGLWSKVEAEASTPRLFVGNLDYRTQEHELRQLFTDNGFTVIELTMVKDRITGEHRGFAFVELDSSAEAARAIGSLHGTDFHERELRVTAADQEQGGRR